MLLLPMRRSWRCMGITRFLMCGGGRLGIGVAGRRSSWWLGRCSSDFPGTSMCVRMSMPGAVRLRQAARGAAARRGVGLVARGHESRRPVPRQPRRSRADPALEARVLDRDAGHEATPHDLSLLGPPRRVAGGAPASRSHGPADVRRRIREASVPSGERGAPQTGLSKPYSRVWLGSSGRTRSPIRRNPIRW